MKRILIRSMVLCFCGLNLTAATGIARTTYAADFTLDVAQVPSCKTGFNYVTVRATIKPKPVDSQDIVEIHWIAFNEQGLPLFVHDCDTALFDPYTPLTPVGSPDPPSFTDTKYVKASKAYFYVLGVNDEGIKHSKTTQLLDALIFEQQLSNQEKLRIFDKAVKKGKNAYSRIISLEGRLNAPAAGRVGVAYHSYYRDADGKRQLFGKPTLVKARMLIEPGKFSVPDFEVPVPEDASKYPLRIVVHAWVEGEEGDEASHDVEIPIYEP